MKKLFTVVMFILILLSLSGCNENYAPKVIDKQLYRELLSMKNESCNTDNEEYYTSYIDNLMYSHQEIDLFPYIITFNKGIECITVYKKELVCLLVYIKV